MIHLTEVASNKIRYKDIIFEIADRQVFVRDAITNDLLKAEDVPADFDMHDLVEWINKKLKK